MEPRSRLFRYLQSERLAGMGPEKELEERSRVTKKGTHKQRSGGMGPEKLLEERSRVVIEEQRRREEGMGPEREKAEKESEMARFSRKFQQVTPRKEQMKPTVVLEKFQLDRWPSGSETADLKPLRQGTSSSAAAAAAEARRRRRRKGVMVEMDGVGVSGSKKKKGNYVGGGS